MDIKQNSSFIEKELGWSPKHSFDKGIEKTIKWYLNNKNWCDRTLIKSGYEGQRLGKGM